MGKSLRASVNKRNNTKLRAKVFGPVEAARNERLSAKLLELAAQPKPAKAEMEIEETGDKAEAQVEADAKEGAEAMEVDVAPAKTAHSNHKSKKSSRQPHRVGKNKKPRNSIAFPSQKQRRTVSKAKKR